ncbi:MAG: single-stranded DNA-binding protein [Legionellales bacterium]|nr:single-stranded DNA-binding protein [Legionellales bacterium]
MKRANSNCRNDTRYSLLHLASLLAQSKRLDHVTKYNTKKSTKNHLRLFSNQKNRLFVQLKNKLFFVVTDFIKRIWKMVDENISVHRNEITIQGEVCAEPQSISGAGNKEFLTLVIGTNRELRNPVTLEKFISTDWHRIIFQNEKLITKAKRKIKFGAEVEISGRLARGTWADGSIEYLSPEIEAINFKLIDRNNNVVNFKEKKYI